MINFVPQIVSHRGRFNAERQGILGNTREAVRFLVGRHADAWIELDARLMPDGELLVIHDGLADLSTNGKGWLANIRAPERESLRLVSSGETTRYKVPTLREVLHLLKDLGHTGKLFLELKHGPADPPGVLKAVLELLSHFPNQQVALSSFDHKLLMNVPPSMEVGVLTNTSILNLCQYLALFTLGGERTVDRVTFNPDVWNLTDALRQSVQAMGIKIFAYTVPVEAFVWAQEAEINVITDDYVQAREFFYPNA